MSTSYTLEEYFSQTEFYFSESTQEQVLIEEMATPYALNAWNKLRRTFGDDFTDTPLYNALFSRILPTTTTIRESLDRYGTASVWVGERAALTVQGARSRLRRAGARRTHKDGSWVRGDLGEVDVHVHRKGSHATV